MEVVNPGLFNKIAWDYLTLKKSKMKREDFKGMQNGGYYVLKDKTMFLSRVVRLISTGLYDLTYEMLDSDRKVLKTYIRAYPDILSCIPARPEDIYKSEFSVDYVRSLGYKPILDKSEIKEGDYLVSINDKSPVRKIGNVVRVTKVGERINYEGYNNSDSTDIKGGFSSGLIGEGIYKERANHPEQHFRFATESEIQASIFGKKKEEESRWVRCNPTINYNGSYLISLTGTTTGRNRYEIVYITDQQSDRIWYEKINEKTGRTVSKNSSLTVKNKLEDIFAIPTWKEIVNSPIYQYRQIDIPETEEPNVQKIFPYNPELSDMKETIEPAKPIGAGNYLKEVHPMENINV